MKTDISKLNFRLALIVALVAAALYANTIGHGFVYDDVAAVTENYMVKQGVRGIPELLATSYHRGYFVYKIVDEVYRPFSLIVFAVIHQFFGENPMPYHLLNIMLYALTGFFLFKLLSSLRAERSNPQLHGGGLLRSFLPRNDSIPFIASLVFIAHPIHTEVVANIKSADEIISFLFVLFTILLILRYLEKGSAFIRIEDYRGWGFILRRHSFLPFLAMICFFIALMAKEGVITMVGVIPLTIYFFKDVRIKKLAGILLMLLIPAMTYLVMRKMALGTFSGVKQAMYDDNILSAAPDIYIKLATAFKILTHYIRLMIFPHPLACDYSSRQMVLNVWDFTSTISLLFHAGLFIYALTGIRKKSIFSFGILFYLLTISLYSNIFIMIGTHFGERLLYIPLLGFCIIMAVLLSKIESRRLRHFKVLPAAAAYSILTLVLILYSYKTISRNAEWKGGLTLYASDIKNSPNSARLRYLYAEKIITEIITTAPPGDEKRRWADLAMAHLDTAILINPNYADAYGQRGYIYFLKGDKDNAIINYTKSVELKTSSLSIINNFGVLYHALGRYPQALELYQRVVEMNPRAETGWQNVGTMHALMRENHKAVAAYLTSLKFDPENAKTNFLLGSVYQITGESASAEPYFEKAFSLDPSLKNATNPFRQK